MDPDKIEIKALLIAGAAVLGVEYLARLAATAGLASLAAVGLARIVQAVLVVLIVKLTSPGLPVMGLGKGTLLKGAWLGLIWSAGFGLAAVVGLGAMHLAGLNPLSLFAGALPSGSFDIFLVFLVGGLISPIAEEMFFRGLVFGFFRRWGFVLALIVSTLIFGLAHLPQTRIPITQTVGGLVFAISYEHTKSLMAPIVIHVLGNLALFGLSFIGRLAI